MSVTNPSESVNWLENVVQRRDGYEWQAVERFTNRLLRLAGSRLPNSLQGRVDADDVVQSAFRSFFTRNQDGQFHFAESADVWRLLAAITYRKVQRSIRYHSQKQRDVRRESPGGEATMVDQRETPSASALVVMEETLGNIIEQLPETHRQIIGLRLEGYSIDEIASSLQVSTRTVDRGLALARKIAIEQMDP